MDLKPHDLTHTPSICTLNVIHRVVLELVKICLICYYYVMIMHHHVEHNNSRMFWVFCFILVLENNSPYGVSLHDITFCGNFPLWLLSRFLHISSCQSRYDCSLGVLIGPVTIFLVFESQRVWWFVFYS